MDSLITAAARALAAGDVFAALNHVALRSDPAALALRGIALAQIGDLDRARALVRSAERGFGPREAVARARCAVAEAEIALATRDLAWPAKRLHAAAVTLERHGDRLNAQHARHLEARRLLLTGRLDEAERALAELRPGVLPPAFEAAQELALAEIAMRRRRAKAARAALGRAAEAARRAGIALLVAEVEAAQARLERPAARLIRGGRETVLTLDAVESLEVSQDLVVDTLRFLLRRQGTAVSLVRRPVPFAIVRALAEVWPADLARAALIARAFGAAHADESHRVRLRVEVARLRALARPLLDVRATRAGFCLVPHDGAAVLVLAGPADERHAAVMACLQDGEAWSSSSLALALGTSQRSVQRALDVLAASGKVRAVGEGRARRWTTQPIPAFTTSLLLPPVLPTG